MLYRFISKHREYQYILGGGVKREVGGVVIPDPVKTVNFEPRSIEGMGGIVLGYYETTSKAIADRLKGDPTFKTDYDEYTPPKPVKPMTEREIDRFATAMKAKVRSGNKVTLRAEIKDGDPKPEPEPEPEPKSEPEEEQVEPEREDEEATPEKEEQVESPQEAAPVGTEERE